MTRWKDIPGTDGRYEVSDAGQVRRKAYVLKPSPNVKTGHMYVSLGGSRRALVHRLVAHAFIEAAESKPCVNHLDGNPANNAVGNLEWSTVGENNLHGYRSNGRVHYSNIRVLAIRSDNTVAQEFQSMAAAARALGVTRGAIRSALVLGGVCCGFRWEKAT